MWYRDARAGRWLAGVAVGTLLWAAAPVNADAQGKSDRAQGRRQDAPGQAKTQDDGQSQKPGKRRAALEQQYRQRGAQVIREKLQLTDEQMKKLRTVNQRFDGQRRELLRQETGLRAELRTEVAKGNRANQGRVKQLMSQADALHRQRFDLVQDELKEIGGFLTPVQQARYQGLQAQLRKRVENMREAQGEAAERR